MSISSYCKPEHKKVIVISIYILQNKRRNERLNALVSKSNKKPSNFIDIVIVRKLNTNKKMVKSVLTFIDDVCIHHTEIELQQSQLKETRSKHEHR